MLITMVLLAPLPPPLGFLLFTLLGLFLFVRLMFFGLHRIFKLAIPIRCHLDHFQSLAISCMQLLLMNIDMFCSSPIDILFGVMNGSYSFNLSI